MKKDFLLLFITLIFLVSGCVTYSPEVKDKIESCKKIIGWGDCEMALAIEQKDNSICNFINNRYYEEVCKMMINGQFDKCDDIQQWDFSEGNPSLEDFNYDAKAYGEAQANAILIPTKSSTIKICHTWSAILSNDVSRCNKLENYDYPFYKDSCILEYTRETGNALPCKDIRDESIRKICLNTTGDKD